MAYGPTQQEEALRKHDDLVSCTGPATVDVFKREAERLSGRGAVDRVLVTGEASGTLAEVWASLLPRASVTTARDVHVGHPGQQVPALGARPSAGTIAAASPDAGGRGDRFDIVVASPSRGFGTFDAFASYVPLLRPGGVLMILAGEPGGGVARAARGKMSPLRRVADFVAGGAPKRPATLGGMPWNDLGARVARLSFDGPVIVVEMAGSADLGASRSSSIDVPERAGAVSTIGLPSAGRWSDGTVASPRDADSVAVDLQRMRSALQAARRECADAETERQEARRELVLAQREAAERLGSMQAALAGALAELEALRRSTSWRLTRPLRALTVRANPLLLRLRLLARAAMPGGAEARAVIRASAQRRILGSRPATDLLTRQHEPDATSSYGAWRARFDTPSGATLDAITAHAASDELRPLTVVAVFQPSQEAYAESLLESLRAQVFTRWNAVLLFHEACSEAIVTAVQSGASRDGRIQVQAALAGPMRIPEGQAVVVCDGRVVLRNHALYLFAAALAERPGLSLAYADEDRLAEDGTPSDPFFKPSFSPELLRSRPYLGPCILLAPGTFETDRLAEEALREGLDALATRLALSARAETVEHVSQIAYHSRGEAGQATPPPAPPAAIPAGDLPVVTIIIPTRDKVELLRPCLESIAARTDYPADRIDVVVVDNGSSEAATLNYLRVEAKAGRIRVLRDRRPFNYARLNNAAARIARGDILLFLNNDTVVNDDAWLRKLVSQASRPDVGAVGCKLLYPDHTVQHGGVILGICGVAAHAHVGIGENEPGYHGFANATHEISAVTGACLAMRRSVFEEIGGFDEGLAVAFNDVLLCLDAQARSYRNLYIGDPLMEHHESKSRGPDDTPRKRAVFRQEALYTRRRHPRLLRDDPYYNPNLSVDAVHGLAEPPRAPKPWRRHARRMGAPIRVLMLSSTHALGHGVAVVLEQQAKRLVHEGFEVIMAGPKGPRDLDYPGCDRAVLHDAREAACLAHTREVDVVVAHTPPFFSAVRWLSPSIPFIAYDYGEPPPALFDDALQRIEQNEEKAFALTMADRIYAISRAIRDESPSEMTGVIPLANSHLARWSDALAPRRAAERAELGWEGRFVVLNVCRFHEAERRYKGVDVYAEVAERFGERFPDLKHRVVFALCGKAAWEDIENMEAIGLSVFANVSDQKLVDLYAAADGYMNFSKWEGYNLGIGQALAMGLPVIASDIPAHREFPIPTESDVERVVEWLAARVTDPAPVRSPVVFSWDEPTAMFAGILREVCAVTPAPARKDEAA